jgi:hypothetical protein
VPVKSPELCRLIRQARLANRLKRDPRMDDLKLRNLFG